MSLSISLTHSLNLSMYQSITLISTYYNPIQLGVLDIVIATIVLILFKVDQKGGDEWIDHQCQRGISD